MSVLAALDIPAQIAFLTRISTKLAQYEITSREEDGRTVEQSNVEIGIARTYVDAAIGCLRSIDEGVPFVAGESPSTTSDTIAPFVNTTAASTNELTLSTNAD